MSPDVVVLLGTDHHPFDRLVDWADAWAEENPDRPVLIQHGHSRAPRVAAGVGMLDQEALRRLVKSASAVVTHGGPGTMVDVRAGGHTPLVVPRDPRRGEHVDDHQQKFAGWAAGKGLVRAVPDIAELATAVQEELASPTPLAAGAGDPRASVQALAQLLRQAPTGPVLFVAGFGRSGSTVLERVLGQDPRVVTLGEVVHLWARGISKNELCGCGEPFHDCEFWREVGVRAFGGWDRVDLDRLRNLAQRVDRQRALLRTAAPVATPSTRRSISLYAEHYRRVYAAAQQITGAEVVVDSSKHPSLAVALSHDARVDLRVLHLVRDSLGVAHSWAKAVRRPEARASEDELMTRYSAPRSSAKWVATNLESELARARGVPFARLRYEEFVASPREELSRLWRELRLPGEPPDVVDGSGRVQLGPNHSVAGNPVRFTVGETTLRPDDAWRTAFDASQRRKVALLTAPMRFFYGYTRLK